MMKLNKITLLLTSALVCISTQSVAAEQNVTTTNKQSSLQQLKQELQALKKNYQDKIAANAVKTASPASCPYLSLIPLKLSISYITNVKGV